MKVKGDYFEILSTKNMVILSYGCRKPLNNSLLQTTYLRPNYPVSSGIAIRGPGGTMALLDSKKVTTTWEKSVQEGKIKKNQKEKAKIRKVFSLCPSCQMVLAIRGGFKEKGPVSSLRQGPKFPFW